MRTLATLLPLRLDIKTNGFIFANASGGRNADSSVTKANILDYPALCGTFGQRALRIRRCQRVSVSLPRRPVIDAPQQTSLNK
jgi:hypothetical protein